MSTSASSPLGGAQMRGESSTQAGTPNREADEDSASDDDPVANHARDQSLLSGDPLDHDLTTRYRIPLFIALDTDYKGLGYPLNESRRSPPGWALPTFSHPPSRKMHE